MLLSVKTLTGLIFSCVRMHSWLNQSSFSQTNGILCYAWLVAWSRSFRILVPNIHVGLFLWRNSKFKPISPVQHHRVRNIFATCTKEFLWSWGVTSGETLWEALAPSLFLFFLIPLPFPHEYSNTSTIQMAKSKGSANSIIQALKMEHGFSYYAYLTSLHPIYLFVNRAEQWAGNEI